MQRISRSGLLLPAAIAGVAALAVIMLWQALRRDHEGRVANVLEATSYATRSELARRLIIQFQSLQALADFWLASTAESDLPAGAEAPLELIRFEGVDAIAWGDNTETRFLASGEHRVLGYEPSPGEWMPMEPLVAAASAAAAATTLGPFVDADGHAIFHYYLPIRRAARHGALVAIIDAHELLGALLVDEALGYEIRVSCCEGTEIYRRGAADDELPAAWTRDGWITPAPGVLWNVTHRPSAALATELEASAVDSVLIVGLALALLLGGLVFETRRANERAVAASAAEQRIREFNRELEDRVVARTQKLDDVLSDLNTINLSVSHDLRSPLNSISLLAGRLRETAGPDTEATARLDKIAANVERMAVILDRLLGYSRASSFASDFEDIDMRALVEQVVREQAIDRRAVSLGELPPARADRVVTHILLSNLLGNAVKHGRSGRSLRVEIGSVQTPEGPIAYFVRDNGPGLTQELADQLFKPLTDRAPAATGEGLGLGLAIAARAVDRHGGKIWAENGARQGATFWFTLRAPAPADQD